MSDQLSLFGEPETKPNPVWERLGSQLPANIRLGTSSFAFEGWKGLVYQRRYKNKTEFTRESLAEYASSGLFRSVGLDRGYYNPMSAEDLAAYAKQLPTGFKALIKVWSELTTSQFADHPRLGERRRKSNPAFLNRDVLFEQVLAPIQESFSEFAGPIVFELTPTPDRVDEAQLIHAMQSSLRDLPSELDFAVEVRDRRLLTPRYFDTLRELGLSHVYNYWSRVPTLRQQLELTGGILGDQLVVRAMIPPGERYSELRERFAPFNRLVAPQPEMREDILELLRHAKREAKASTVIVNNKAEGCSPRTVEALAQLIVKDPVLARSQHPAAKDEKDTVSSA